MILSIAKPLNEKMREHLKILKKRERKNVSNFSYLSVDDMKTQKKQNPVLLV